MELYSLNCEVEDTSGKESQYQESFMEEMRSESTFFWLHKLLHRIKGQIQRGKVSKKYLIIINFHFNSLLMIYLYFCLSYSLKTILIFLAGIFLLVFRKITINCLICLLFSHLHYYWMSIHRSILLLNLIFCLWNLVQCQLHSLLSLILIKFLCLKHLLFKMWLWSKQHSPRSGHYLKVPMMINHFFHSYRQSILLFDYLHLFYRLLLLQQVKYLHWQAWDLEDYCRSMHFQVLMQWRRPCC